MLYTKQIKLKPPEGGEGSNLNFTTATLWEVGMGLFLPSLSLPGLLLRGIIRILPFCTGLNTGKSKIVV